MLVEIIKTLGASAMALAALTYLAKALLEKLLSRDLAEHKARLDAHTQASIENLKLQIRVQAFEHEAAYQHVLAMRLRIISELHGNLMVVLRSFERLFSVVPPQLIGGELIESASRAWEEFDEHFDRNRLYLPRQTIASINSFAGRLRAIRHSFEIEISGRLPNAPKDPIARDWIASSKAWIALQEHVQASLTQLDEEFRVLLGSRVEIFPNHKQT